MKREGFEEGEQQEKIETAKRLLESGFEIKDIHKITELSIEEIGLLANSRKDS